MHPMREDPETGAIDGRETLRRERSKRQWKGVSEIFFLKSGTTTSEF